MSVSLDGVKAVRTIDGGAAVVDVTRPEGEGVLVRVGSAGICGSDLHLIDLFPLPSTLGHEFAGWLPDGTPVAVEPLDVCGTCPACEAGDYNRCVQAPTGLLGVSRDGGMAEWCMVPERALVRLPAGLAVRDACLVEPIAVAVHGWRRAGLPKTRRVAVVGGGSIGLAAAVVARSAGLRVDIVARHEHQRAAADRLGARPIDDGHPDSYRVVVDAVGTTESVAQALRLVSAGGTVLALGTYWAGVEFPVLDMCMREITFVPASMYSKAGMSRDVDVAAALLATYPDIAATLITHRFPLDSAVEAFATAGDRSSGSIKVVLEP